MKKKKVVKKDIKKKSPKNDVLDGPKIDLTQGIITGSFFNIDNNPFTPF